MAIRSIVLLVVCLGASTLRAQSRSAAPDTMPVHPWVTDDDLALLGVPSLSELAAQAQPIREVRIWLAAWRLECPRPMLRLTEGPETTTGS